MPGISTGLPTWCGALTRRIGTFFRNPGILELFAFFCATISIEGRERGPFRSGVVQTQALGASVRPFSRPGFRPGRSAPVSGVSGVNSVGCTKSFLCKHLQSLTHTHTHFSYIFPLLRSISSAQSN